MLPVKCTVATCLWFAEKCSQHLFVPTGLVIIWVMCATKTNSGTSKKPKICIWFLKLSSSSLAPCLFLSAFQAQVWSGKSITVVKWALSKHPSGAATPLPGSARAWSWMWAPGLIETRQICSAGVYTLHDNRWYLDNMTLYRCTCVQHIITFPLTPLLFSLIPICAFILRLLVCVSLECGKDHWACGRGRICRNA